MVNTLKANLVKVKFLRTKSPYTVGEIAAFPEDKARWYIENGIAREYKKKKKDKEQKQMSSDHRGGPDYVTKD